MPKTKLLLGFLIALILIVPLVYKLLRPGFFPIYDDMQVIRVSEMDSCIKDGQIPCRWVSNLGYGYGYPLFEYYAPLPYYKMEAIHLLGFSFLDSVKAGFILSVIFSGLFFYLFARSFLSRNASLFGTILYLYAPFKAGDLFVRGAMGELWGFVALPLVLWAFELLLKKKSKAAMAFFALSTCVYLISHNLTLAMSLPLVGFWILLRLLMLKVKKETLIKLGIAGLIGIGLSAFYWLPLIFESNLVYLETLKQGYFNYLAHFLSVKQIFISTIWGYGPSIEGPLDDAFLGLGPIASIIGVAGIAFGIFQKKKELKAISLFFGISLLISVFLTHGRSAFIWSTFTFMEYFQFPWRFMLIAIFSSSVLGAILVSNLKKKTSWILIGLLFIGTLVLYGGFYRPQMWLDISDSQKLSGESLERQLTASIYDYLPKSANTAPSSKAPDALIVQEGEVQTLNFDKGSNWFRIEALVGGKSAEVAIPAYNFPTWEVKVNNQKVLTKKTGELGLVGFSLPEGKSEIDAVLAKSLPRKIGDILSLLAILALVFLVTHEYIFSKYKKS